MNWNTYSTYDCLFIFFFNKIYTISYIITTIFDAYLGIVIVKCGFLAVHFKRC